MMILHTRSAVKAEHISRSRLETEGPSMGSWIQVGTTMYIRQPGEKLDAFSARVTAQSSGQGGVKDDVIVRLANGFVGTVEEFLAGYHLEDGLPKGNPPSKDFRVKEQVNVNVRGYHGPLDGWLKTQPD